MANEFKHKTVGTALSQAEWEAVDGHEFDGQAQGDVLYASSATQLSRLAAGSAGNLLQSGGAAANPSWVDHTGAADPHPGYVLESLFDANTILAATSDNTPVALTVAEQRVVGRVTGGGIDDLAIGIADDNILQVDDASAADDDFARFTANGIEGLAAQDALSALLAAVLLENDSVKLDPALSADGKWNGITESGTAGATLAFGDLCYLQTADSRWELASADNAATGCNFKLGICVLAAAGDASATNMLLWGKVRADTAFPALTIGAPVYMGTTAGDVVTTAPSGTTDIVRIVGYGNTADELYFCPENDWIKLV